MRELERLEIYKYFIDDSRFRREIYSRYRVVADRVSSGDIGLIVENKDAYKILCYDVLLWVSMNEKDGVGKVEYNEEASKSEALRGIFKDTDSLKGFIGKLGDIIGVKSIDISVAELIASLSRMVISDDTNETIRDKSDSDINKMGDDMVGTETVLGEEGEYAVLLDGIIDGDSDITKVEQGKGDNSVSDGESVVGTETVIGKEGEYAVSDIVKDGLKKSRELVLNDEILDEIRDKDGDKSDGLDDITYNPDSLVSNSDIAEKQGEITGTDDTSSDDNYDEDIDISDVDLILDMHDIISSVMNRNKAVFKSCLELDRPYGMLYDKGLLTYKVKNGTLRYIPGVGMGKSVFENLYNAIVRGTGAELKSAPDLRNVPNVDNIDKYDSNYYVGHIFKYALGLVDGKKYTSWKKFEVALKLSLENKLKKLYKKELFFKHLEKIERIYSNAILVLSYEPGAGIKLRISLPGVDINMKKLEDAIRGVTTYKSAGITITQVSGYQDVVDVQVLLKEEEFLNRPYWAYKAMRMKLDNGEEISLSGGLPIGRMVNGDIVDFKLDPSTRFLTMLAAGSGAGKGVLTLSLVAAAIGSGVPLFYMDFKPDMAPIFWDIENEYGINTFTYDGMVKYSPNDKSESHSQSYGMPDVVKKELGKYGGAIVYLKCIQLMCAMAQRRADLGAQNDIMFVFDETQAMQRLIKSFIEKVSELNKANKPKKVKGVEEEPNELYTYTSILLDWVKEINVNIDTYVNTTGRKSNTFCVFIGQSPDYNTWTPLKVKTDNGQLELLSRITFADTIFKILGKGSTTSKYGLGGGNVSDKELTYVANNRFFGMYDGKTTDGATVTIFKPFLTLNSDNPFDKCWTKGMGKKYGYGSISDEDYVRNISIEHGGEPGYSNQYGIHTGTGLLGLASMYCGGDIEKLKKGFSSSWEYCIEYFSESGLNRKYSTPSDYMYDASIDGLMMIGNMVEYKEENENSVVKGISTGNTSSNMEEVGDDGLDTGVKLDGYDDNKKSDIGTSGGKGTSGGIDLLKRETDNNKIYKNAKEVVGDKGFDNSLSDKLRMTDARVDDAINSMMSEVPDGADPLGVMNYMLKQDIDNGYMDKELGESVARRLGLKEKGYIDSYDYNNNHILEQDIVEQVPIKVMGDGGEATQVNGKNINIDLDKVKVENSQRLTDDNSIDCRGAGVGELSLFENILLNTPRGAERYIEKLWKSILAKVIDQGYKMANITRVSIYGGNLYINGKIIILNGVLGGRQDIRLRDIVNFGILFKKYPMIRELRLDDEILRVAMLELGENSLEKLFILGKKLDIIYIKGVDGKTYKVGREDINNDEIKDMSRVADMKNRVDVFCKSKSKSNWDIRSASDNIWGMRLAKANIGNASKALMDKDKPSVGKGLLFGALGGVIGVAGFGLWATYNAGKGIIKLGSLFSRR